MEEILREKAQQEKRALIDEKIVLIVDDNADLLSLGRTILELNGIKVYTAQGGQEALRMLGEIKRPDLILLDMRMEKLSGPDFLAILELKMPELVEAVPVVFLSALDEVPQTRAVGFISKPIEDIDRFVQTIHRFIAKGTPKRNYEH